jgi:hypothetical protein
MNHSAKWRKLLDLCTSSVELVLAEKLIVAQLFNKFPVFYRTRRFIVESTRPCHWSLLWDTWIQSTPLHCISLPVLISVSPSARNGPAYAGIPHPNFFLFLNLIPALISIYYINLSRLGGVVISVLATGPKRLRVRTQPRRWIFKGDRNSQNTFLLDGK